MILMQNSPTPQDVRAPPRSCALTSDYMTGQLIMIDGGIVMQ
jgi:hypothetical protein